jgi:hypothetical protein
VEDAQSCIVNFSTTFGFGSEGYHIAVRKESYLNHNMHFDMHNVVARELHDAHAHFVNTICG